MLDRSISGNVVVAARQSEKERRYWTDKLAGQLVKSSFPFDCKRTGTGPQKTGSVTFKISDKLFSKLTWIINESDVLLHMILTAAVNVLLHKFTGNYDIIIASPIYKQDIEGDFINTVLVLRNLLEDRMTFKEFLFQVRSTVNEAVEHQNYPLEAIFHDLNISPGENDCPLFDTVILTENIQCREYIEHINRNILFSFSRTAETLEGVVEYKTGRYEKSTVERIITCFLHLLEQVLFDVDKRLEEIDILPPREKEYLLHKFNDNTIDYPREKTIHELFEQEVDQAPDRTALVYEDEQLTYRELNRRTGYLARALRGAGVGPNRVVGLLTERSAEMIAGILGILKAGGAYLPVESNAPIDRINSLLEESRPSVLLVTAAMIEKYSYTALQSSEFTGVKPVRTPPRLPVAQLDDLPFPDRSLVDYEKYNRYIGQALVKNSVSILASRGCPFNCAFCHKIWPKKHIARSAENIFEEMRLYYRMGVRRFSFVDDIFNLNTANTSKLFQLIIENRLEVELFIILRGDILTREYIDLMVRAGTVRVSMSLETASPRLQKLIGKHLNLKKFRENIRCFCEKYPQVILELNTIHGIPTETPEEARMTLDFIKSLEWVHFPYVHVLKIYQNTEMEKIALKNGISREAIASSVNLAYHELPDTLPFDKGFSKKYQAEFFNDYFLSKERLLHVLPFQMKILTEDEIVQKYDSYLPVNIAGLDDLLDFVGIRRDRLAVKECRPESRIFIPDFNRKLGMAFPGISPQKNALKILLLDLSQHFTGNKKMLYDVVEPPLGLMYLMSYLNRRLPGKINGKIARSRIDFDNYAQLKALLEEFQPDVIGVRTLTFFKNFFHKAIGMIRQWGFHGPLIAGGPYVTGDYSTIFPDINIDLLVLGEGEITFCQIIEKIMQNKGKLPGEAVLKEIPGIAYLPPDKIPGKLKREIVVLDQAMDMDSCPAASVPGNRKKINHPADLAYVMYTSGSSGKPKGVMVEHRSVNNLAAGLKKTIYHPYDLYASALKISLVAPYIFDASVKQIFAALLMGHTLYIVPEYTRMDGRELQKYLIKHQIAIGDGTPIHLRLLLESMESAGAGNFPVKHFIIGGEAFPLNLVEKISALFGTGAPKITNVYGPTECCDVSASYDIVPEDITARDSIPVGKAMPNVRVYILSNGGSLQPIGVVGELCIAGRGVARGYLNQPELTAEKFDHDLWDFHDYRDKKKKKKRTGRRIYKSGDLARWLPDGNIEFVGRKDKQIKIRGFRIEPGEIENHLKKIENIKETVVIDWKAEPGDAFLCAYIVPQNGDGMTAATDPGEKKPFACEKISKTHKEFNLQDLNLDGGLFVSRHLESHETGKGNNEQSTVKHFETLVRTYGPEIAVKSDTGSLTFSALNNRANRLGRVIDGLYDDRFKLSESEKNRYARQLLLDQWGVESQEELKSTTAFVAGAGGIGSQIIIQLASLGFGTIIICDADSVEMSNLNRQTLHDESRIALNKAVSAQQTVERMNPHVNVIVHQQRLTRENIDEFLGDASVIFDCVDDLETKFIMSEAAVARHIPHVLSGMIERNSYTALLHAPRSLCFHCIHDRSKVDEINEMKKLVNNYQRKPFPVAVPALFVTTGFICNEVLKVILGFENPAYNKFFLFNQTGSKRIVKTDGYKQMTYAFNDYFKQACRQQGFDWDECWRGNFVEELIIEPNPRCPVCAKTGQAKIAVDKKPKTAINMSVQPKNRQIVSSALTDEIAAITAAMGTIKAGKIYAPLDMALPEDKLVYILQETGARLILTDSDNLEPVTGARDKVNKRIPVVNVDEHEENGIEPVENLNIELPPDQDAYLLYRFNWRNEDIPITAPALREYLSKKLPRHMIPTYFMQVNEIPLTSNGKIDREALPAPDQGIAAESHTAPRSRIENILVQIWSEVLGIETAKISIDANFFELGGHSLNATAVAAKVHKELDAQLPLVEIFRTPNIRELAEYMEGMVKDIHTSIEPVEEKEYYPLSPAQKRLYILQQIDSASTSYNVSRVIRFEENIDKEKVEAVLKILAARHESLRTSFIAVNDEPAQVIHGSVDFSINIYEAAGREVEMIISNFIKPFDLSKLPLFRVTLLYLDSSQRILFMDMHHIITDATSQDILDGEFLALYRDPGTELPLLRLQYNDYSEWLNNAAQKEAIKHQEAYWLKEFSDELPVLDLPTDFPRPRVQGSEGNRVIFALSREETGILKSAAKENDVTLYMCLLTVFNVLFAKLSGQEDIILGTPIEARRHTDLQHIIGMLVNTLAMRNFPAGDKSFEEFLKEVKQRTLDAYENQEYPFEELVDHISVNRDTGRNPAFDVLLNLLNQWEHPDEAPEIDEQPPYRHRESTSRFDMGFSAFDLGERIYFTLEYSTRLFTPATIERFIIYLKNIVLSLPGNTGKNIAEIEYISAEEKEKILDLSAGVEEIPGIDSTIHRMFEQQVEKTPDNIALHGCMAARPHEEVGSVTYKELNQKSNRLARVLRKKGVGPDTVVGVRVERSIEMIAAVLAILKAGGAYMPIDPDYPRERIDFMLKDSNAGVLVSEVSKVSKGIEVIEVNSGVGNRLACSAAEDHLPLSPAPATSLAYVIYTSGSTGKPKGVMLEHRNLLNLARYQYKYTNIDFHRVLQFATISFDVSAQEIFSTLLAGGYLVLISRQTQGDVPELFAAITKENLETVFWPASILRLVMNEEEFIKQVPGGLKHIVTAGEQVIVNERFRRYLQDNNVYFHNHYGPTETHVATTATFEPGGEIPALPPIGRPLANTGIYILDRRMRLVPVGVPGELVIGGMQVGRGYLNNPELTAEKFDHDLWDSQDYRDEYSPTHPLTHSPIYRTGDLARWLSDGNLEFLGRMDHQVKIRGFRVELGEIENRLLDHGEIKECVVLAKSDETKGKYICAYVVMDDRRSFAADELRRYLSRQLPDYMVPSFFMPIETIPLTPNGKIDRKVLPEPVVVTGAEEYSVPRNYIEKKLAEIWSGILGIEERKMSTDANFFSIGGHSLTATVMAARVHRELNVRLPLLEIFKTPTIKGLAEYIEGLTEDRYVSIESVEKREFYPLSSAQKRLYILKDMDKRGINYNMPFVSVLEGNIDRNRLENTFLALIRRHESLRTSFEMLHEEPVQRIHDQVEFSIEYYEKNVVNDFVRAFDLDKAPLLRVGLIKEEQERHIFMVDMHHIITDGVSLGIIVREFISLYGGADLPGINLHYKDFSRWQNSEKTFVATKNQEDYWIKEFQGEIPVLDLPGDFQRPAIQSFEGNSLSFEIDRDLTAGLKVYTSEEGVTLFMVILAIYNIFLFKISGQEDVVVGTPIAGRRHEDLAHIVGMFVNTLALRNFPCAEKNVEQFLKEVKERSLKAFTNQDYQYEELIEKIHVTRDAGRNPLFDTLLSFQNFDVPELKIPGLNLKPYPPRRQISRFDLTLACLESEETLRFSFQYCTKLFKEETIKAFIIYFRQVLSSVIKMPQIKLGQIEIITEDAKQEILVDFNDTDAGYPGNKTIHELFAEQAERTPDGVAVVGSHELHEKRKGSISITYKELNDRSDQLAHALRKQGAGPGTIAGIMVERSVEMIIGIIGILKAGGAYLPIDSEYPKERIHYMLKDSNAGVLLKNSEIRISKFETNPNDQNSNDRNKAIPGIVLNFEHLDFEFVSDFEFRASNLSSSNLAYIIYTSGTTGKPKGTMIEHRNVVRLMVNERFPFDFDHGDVWTMFHSFCFDFSVWEMYGALLYGGKLIIVPKMATRDSGQYLKILKKHGVTVLNQVPSVFYVLMELELKSPGRDLGLRYVIFGGEALNPGKLKEWKAKYPGTRIVNMYGITETTVHVTYKEIGSREIEVGVSNIGKPIPTLCTYVVDKYLNLQPVGIVGELYVSGDGVGRGYLNRPELTAERFDRDLWDFQDYQDEKKKRTGKKEPIYRTGDLARWLPGGELEFLGRIDQQVKIRGFRIELAEIENQLLTHDKIKETVVVLKEHNRDKHLCAYIAADPAVNAPGLREFLSGKLPDYMIPSYFVSLEKIPLTPNGKVDRRALPDPRLETGEAYTAPFDETEEKLVKIWSEVLGIEKEKISTNANFFALGGHSLQATVVMSRISLELNVTIPLTEVFRTPTVRELGEYIKKTENKPPVVQSQDNILVLLRKNLENAGHLFFIHDGSGETEGYIELCDQLNNRFHYWGIRAPRPGNFSPQNITVRELAAVYIEKIRNLQPNPPYSLAGWSLGGIIAFEMTRQLEDMEKQVDFLVLLDSPAPRQDPQEHVSYFDIESELNWLMEYLPDNRIREMVKNASRIDEIWRLVIEHMEKNNFSIKSIRSLVPDHFARVIPNFQLLGIREMVGCLNLNRSFRRALEYYRPSGKIQATLYYLKASESSGIFQESWQAYCRNSIKSYEIPGSHFSILKKPAIDKTAALFNNILSERYTNIEK